MISLDQYSLISQHLIMTEHLNPNNNIFGGQLLAWLDKDLYIYICNEVSYKALVTLSFEHVRFKKPAKLGEILRIYGKIKLKKRSSITAFGKAVAYDPESKEMREIIECEVTFVALDSQGKPTRIFEQLRENN